MERSLLDRWTDTAAFRLVLILSGLVTVPALLVGLVAASMLLIAAVAQQRADFASLVIVLLSAGGAVGFVGYLRARRDAKYPRRRDLTPTLTFLAVGIATALFVAALVASEAIASWRSPWSSDGWVTFAAPLIAAHVVWALAGVGWMQRVAHRYAETTGRLFDALPIVFLWIVIALVTAAVLVTAAL